MLSKCNYVNGNIILVHVHIATQAMTLKASIEIIANWSAFHVVSKW
jgi:hypothetical protein